MERALPECPKLTIESLTTPIGVLRIVTDGAGVSSRSWSSLTITVRLASPPETGWLIL